MRIRCRGRRPDGHGLPPHPGPERARQRVLSVPGGVGTVDHLRRHPHRQLRPRLILHAGGVHRLHTRRADRRLGTWRLLGGLAAGGRRRGCAGRADRGHYPAPRLSRAGALSAARHLWRGADRPGPGGAGLGPTGSARSARAGAARRGAHSRIELPRLRPAADRPRPRRAACADAALPADTLGHFGARRDTGPGDGDGARHPSGPAIHSGVPAGRLPRRTGRRGATASRLRASRDGPADHRRDVRRCRRGRPRQRSRRLPRVGVAGRAQCVRHRRLPAGQPGAGVPGDGGGSGGPPVGPARPAGGDAARPRRRLGYADPAFDARPAGHRFRAGTGARHTAGVRRRLPAECHGRGDDLRAVRGEPALPDGRRRHGVVRSRRLLRARRLWRGVGDHASRLADGGRGVGWAGAGGRWPP